MQAAIVIILLIFGAAWLANEKHNRKIDGQSVEFAELTLEADKLMIDAIQASSDRQIGARGKANEVLMAAIQSADKRSIEVQERIFEQVLMGCGK